MLSPPGYAPPPIVGDSLTVGDINSTRFWGILTTTPDKSHQSLFKINHMSPPGCMTQWPNLTKNEANTACTQPYQQIVDWTIQHHKTIGTDSIKYIWKHTAEMAHTDPYWYLYLIDPLCLPPNACLFTYDTVSMYTNINTTQCLTRLTSYLDDPTTSETYPHLSPKQTQQAPNPTNKSSIAPFNITKQLAQTELNKSESTQQRWRTQTLIDIYTSLTLYASHQMPVLSSHMTQSQCIPTSTPPNVSLASLPISMTLPPLRLTHTSPRLPSLKPFTSLWKTTEWNLETIQHSNRATQQHTLPPEELFTLWLLLQTYGMTPWFLLGRATQHHTQPPEELITLWLLSDISISQLLVIPYLL